MAYFGMSKNGSGYKDETAYKALMGMAKPGDVWTAGDGREQVLILKNQGSFVNCLTLADARKHEHMMEVNSAGTYYTNPAMVKYLFCEKLGTFVQRLPADEFDRVLETVEEALRFPRLKYSRKGKTEKQRQECHALLDKILDRAEGI